MECAQCRMKTAQGPARIVKCTPGLVSDGSLVKRYSFCRAGVGVSSRWVRSRTQETMIFFWRPLPRS